MTDFLQVIYRATTWICMWSSLTHANFREPLVIGCNRWETVAQAIFSRFGWRANNKLGVQPSQLIFISPDVALFQFYIAGCGSTTAQFMSFFGPYDLYLIIQLHASIDAEAGGIPPFQEKEQTPSPTEIGTTYLPCCMGGTVSALSVEPYLSRLIFSLTCIMACS